MGALFPVAVVILVMVEVSNHGLLNMSSDSKQVASFGIVVVIWSRVAYNMWLREQAFFVSLWNITNTEGAERPEYFGSLEASPLDKNIKEKRYPTHKKAMRRLLTLLITILFCSFAAFCVITWVDIFDGHMDISASLCLTIQIKVFEAIWNMLTPKLTNFENHRIRRLTTTVTSGSNSSSSQ